MWTLDRKKTPKTHKICATFGPKPLAGLIWQQEETSLLSPMTMKSHKHSCFRSSMESRHNKWNVRIILPVIHETSDLAKKMYIQDGNFSVVQSISNIPDYEPSIRKTHNTMEGSGVLQKKMLELQLRARSNLGKEHLFSICHKLQYSQTCTDPPYTAPGAL
jgi:hypothetical protein